MITQIEQPAYHRGSGRLSSMYAHRKKRKDGAEIPKCTLVEAIARAGL